MDEQLYDRLVLATYQTAVDERAWDDVLEILGHTFPSVRVHLSGQDLDTHEVFALIANNYLTDFVASYHRYYNTINPYAGVIMSMPVARAMAGSELYDLDALKRSEFYADWLRPQENLLNGGLVCLARTERRFVAFGGHVPVQDQDRTLAPWLTLLGRLTPHMQQAQDLARSLALVRLAAKGGAGPDAAVLQMDAQGRVTWANAAGRAALEGGEPVRLDASQRLTGSGALGPLLAHCRGLLVRKPSDAVAALTLQPEAGSAGWHVRILPCSEDPPLFPSGRRPPARLFVIAVRMSDALRNEADRLRAAFGLTPAEARLCLALADGETPLSLAERGGLSIHTVRNQIKSAMAKLGAHRQADLVLAVDRLRRSLP